MWTDIEHKIRTILDTISFLNPISARIILNRNAGRSDPEDLRLYSIGRANNVIEGVDSRFYGIMRTQRVLKIPSLQQSSLLSNLAFGDGSAVFFPVNSRYGYCGFIWACFRADDFTEQVSDSFVGCCEWLELLIQRWLDSELNVQKLANHYVDLLERLKIPALILITPDRLLVSNPSFEGMKDKEAFLTALRQDSESSDEMQNRFAKFD